MMQQQILKSLLVTTGFLSLSLGVLGIFLPLLPTTVFILFAGFCFARSSEKFHLWLIRHKHFGPIVSAWEKDRSISRKNKIKAITLLWLSISVSIAIIWKLWATLLLLTIATLVSLYLINLPTTRD